MSMKPTLSLDSEEYAVTTQAPPLFAASASQPVTSLPMSPTSTLLDTEFPLFEEATQTASRYLGIPICFVGITTPDAVVLKAALGLSQLGLMNPLARTRRLPLNDALSTAVLHPKRSLVLPRIPDSGPFTESYLVREYGIRSYIGIPLLTSEGKCLGLLAAMDTETHSFSAEAIAFMELLARWSISEYERHQLTQALAAPSATTTPGNTAAPTDENYLLDTVRLTLISQLTQDLRNPLTTITGMANMLSREIYGTLTPKQREYADIVHTSSQYLLKVASEMLELSGLDARIQPLHPTSVDVDMVGQHIQQMLAPISEEKNQELRFTVEPGSRLWHLDRDVVRHSLYHLLFSIIQLSKEGGTIRVHSAERDSALNISVRMTHPWLGDGIPNRVATLHKSLGNTQTEATMLSRLLARATGRADTVATAVAHQSQSFQPQSEFLQSRETLSLLLSRHLIERHGGTLTLLEDAESNYRFLVTLPFLGTTPAA